MASCDHFSTNNMLNIYITQITVVGDRQFKYSAFIPILPWSALGNSSHVLQVFAIEFGNFAIEFVPFAIEFVAFAIEFVPFAIEFVGFAIEFVPFAIEFVGFAIEFIAFAVKFVRNKNGSWSKHENMM